ncbi:MAG: tRNA pseudouridine(55) synthase TruB [Clostridia bacterium]|nr:tRNA pseudouridine(55) synthase TruB [Clostridia bacterium]
MQATTPSLPDGVLIVNKHAGVTSHDIVGKVRRLYGTRAVGHAGTLDPMATGVLVVLLGRAAKASEYLTGAAKRYIATLRLGITTDTEDTTGEVLSQCDTLPDAEAVAQTVARFAGEILQTPPMYSALKRDGQKLVDLARRGITVEREARAVTVYAIACTPTEHPDEYTLDVTCSGGTYIRTLCADIGAALGCGGAMSALQRVSACGFALQQSHTIEQLEQLDESARRALLIPTEALFAALPSVQLSPFYYKLCRNGCAVAQKKLHLALPPGTRVRMYTPERTFFALGEIVLTDEGEALKTVKVFTI